MRAFSSAPCFADLTPGRVPGNSIIWVSVFFGIFAGPIGAVFAGLLKLEALRLPPGLQLGTPFRRRDASERLASVEEVDDRLAPGQVEGQPAGGAHVVAPVLLGAVGLSRLD